MLPIVDVRYSRIDETVSFSNYGAIAAISGMAGGSYLVFVARLPSPLGGLSSKLFIRHPIKYTVFRFFLFLYILRIVYKFLELIVLRKYQCHISSWVLTKIIFHIIFIWIVFLYMSTCRTLSSYKNKADKNVIPSIYHFKFFNHEL